MKKQRNLSPGDWQLLSAYLDNQLSDKEKRQVDERLQTDPECRQTLDALRRTSLMMRSLPVRRVPKNFTLSSQPAPKKRMSAFIEILRFASAAAALLLVAVFTLDLKQSPSPMAASKAAEDMQPAVVAMEAAKAPEEEPPMIIFWGAPAPVMGAYGKGGGGGGAEGYGVGGGGAAPGFYGVGGGGAPAENIPEAVPSVEEVPAAEVLPQAESAVPQPVEGIQPPAVEPQAVPAPEPLTGSGPILGVRSSDEQELANAAVEIPLRQLPASAGIPFSLIEIILGIILLVTALPAWLLKRK